MKRHPQQGACAELRSPRSLLRLAVAAAAVLIGLVAAPSAEAAPCDTPANEIVAENCNAGAAPGDWQISGAGNQNMQGFAADISVNQGETARFKVDAGSTPYRIDIYRLGWYGGQGARFRGTATQPSPTSSQPACTTEAATGLIECGNWGVSATWAVPASATSGVYIGVVKTLDGAPQSHIAFVVRDDDGRSDLLFQTSDTTWQAYNSYGGNSLYTGSPAGRAYKVSYDRPFNTAGGTGEDWLFNSEYPMIRWLERNGFDVSYFTGVDGDRLGGEIREHKAFLSVGHDEYWSGGQRANVEAARNAGVDLAFFSGNEVFWKTRWEDNHRTLVSYKETHAGAKIDPLPNVWTGTWRDPRFSPPADGGRPENALTGTSFLVNSGTRAIEVPAAEGRMRLWRGTAAASLPAGGVETLPDGTLGYEWDTDPDNGARPAGLVRLSSTTATDVEILQDFGSTYATGNANHYLTLYRDPNGAGPDGLVFGAGTVQWSWGLDADHVRGGEPASPVMQQATYNLFADMGVQPATLQAGLLPASASTDTIAPTATITSPATIGVSAGTPQTIQGTATDRGGGVVGAVEVSVDGGATWHPAAGRATWTYTWTPDASGTVTPLARAADDSGNLTGADQSTPQGGGNPSPSGTGTPGAQTPAGGTGRAARVVDVITRRARVSRSGRVRLRFACLSATRDCHVRLRLRLDRRTIAKRTFTVKRDGTRRVTVKLDRAARRKLARKGSLRVTAVVTARGRTTRAAIRLLAPKEAP